MRKLPKDVLKMASGLISPSGLAGHRRPQCNDLMEEDALAQNTVSLLFIYKDSELATVDCYKLQVSSVMMIMIMRSKYFL